MLRAWLGIPALLALAAAACSDGGYDVRVVFSPQSLAASAERIELAVVGDCATQTLGEPARGPLFSRTLVRGSALAPIGELPPGRRGLYARALGGRCEVVGAGCVDVTLEAGGSGTLTVTVGARSGTGCAAGTVCVSGSCVAGDAALDGPVVDAPEPDGPLPTDDAPGLDTSAAGPDADTGVPDPDTGVPDPDTGVPDPDTGAPGPDTGTPDTGVADPDTGVPGPDTGMPDTGVMLPDAGPTCGDNRLGAPEVCDDGDLLSNDCCSSDCMTDLCTETEVNDTTSTANVVGLGRMDTGGIEPLADVDYWRFSVSTRSLVQLATSNPAGGPCGASIDTQLELLSGTGATIETNNDITPGSNLCSEIRRIVAPGTYYVRVIRRGNNAVVDRYVLQVTDTPTSCGDGAITGTEVCDDGNLAPGDCCNFCLPTCTEREPNGTPATATPLAPGTPSSGMLPAGDTDYFTFTLSQPASVEIEIFRLGGADCDNSLDTVATLYGPGPAPARASDDDNGSGRCSHIDPDESVYAGARYLPAGTYYVEVEPAAGSVAPYEVVLRLHPATEVEPNHLGPITPSGMGSAGNNFGPAAANLNGAIHASSMIQASISPVGDEDTFAIRNAGGAPAMVSFVTSTNAAGACVGASTWVTVRDAASTELAPNVHINPGAGNLCSDVSYSIPPAGVVYVHVLAVGDATAIPTYWLRVTFP